ncbi:hypothetical protein V8B55DRAFT_1523782 [Mucor lusitanicus]|uniref:Uncharacterized protein n=2 Tax=Mucor circinelloides f. lusitanicus TaxID=29924 RepID=A0A168LPB6_MUCCL|nr:hypothetical protein FB192DRAFT_1392503 [Mucor lusitanicus]OAD03791.1 hypothetical protein MUCCIDRAFT_110671 [Mucor lusitanicus CBS 277.49]
MDVIAAEVFSKWYIYLYEQIGPQIHAPTPDQLFQIVTQIAAVLYEHSPPIVRTYYTILNSIPVQTDIIPVALAMLILYALFAIIVVTIRGLFRLVYGFIRLSIIISLLAALVCIVLQYTSVIEGSPFDQFFHSSPGTLSRTSPHPHS